MLDHVPGSPAKSLLESQDRHISQQNVEIQEVRASKSMIQVMGGVAGGIFFTWNIQACIIYW